MFLRNKLSKSITYLIVMKLNFNEEKQEIKFLTIQIMNLDGTQTQKCIAKLFNHLDSVSLSMQNALFVFVLLLNRAWQIWIKEGQGSFEKSWLNGNIS